MRITELVASLRGLVEKAEADWRHRHLPPPSRGTPRPDPEALRGAQSLEAAGRTLDAIGGQLRAMPVPEPARLRARHGAAAGTRLTEADAAIAAHAEFLMALLDPAAATAPLEPDALRRSVAHLRELAQARADLLA